MFTGRKSKLSEISCGYVGFCQVICALLALMWSLPSVPRINRACFKNVCLNFVLFHQKQMEDSAVLERRSVFQPFYILLPEPRWCVLTKVPSGLTRSAFTCGFGITGTWFLLSVYKLKLELQNGWFLAEGVESGVTFGNQDFWMCSDSITVPLLEDVLLFLSRQQSRWWISSVLDIRWCAQLCMSNVKDWFVFMVLVVVVVVLLRPFMSFCGKTSRVLFSPFGCGMIMYVTKSGQKK